MSDDLERDLPTIISRASRRAPQAPQDLPTQVMGRSRRRRARTQSLIAAVAVAIVAGGVGAGTRAMTDGGPVTAVDPTPTSSPTGQAPEPIEKVWPDAVYKIPAKLPGGKKARPQIFIDERTLLLETWESFEKADAIYAYDLDTGQSRKIADIRTPKGVFASGYAAGEGRIVWQTIDDRRTQFWSVPLRGGTPAAIPTDAPVKGGGDGLVVIGGKIAFSLSEGGVFTLPLEGGTVTPVEGAERHHILRWPWVGTPGSYTPDNEPSFEEILNVETGETSKALVRPGDRYVRCGVTTCTGTSGDERYFFRLRDGSLERALSQRPLFGAAYDRFTTVRLPNRNGEALLDLVTGESGDFGLRPDAKGRMISIQPDVTDRLLSYELKGKYVVIDLAKI
ncbi:hypothetical protein [Nonomuraea sp. SYSU D8015]|uniref:hypothetical protein n=1 Tax=Nonomuraea sp. SYSU D8015 TaxID=2593644 RepID=UPI001660D9CD|nr:hypothetical protein [Nonomuraea sp. SYSU D8015]